MRNRNTLRAAFLIAALICQPGYTGLASATDQALPELRLTLNVENGTVRGSDPIRVRILVENRSAVDVVLNRRMIINKPTHPGEIYFKVTSPTGKSVPFESQLRVRPDSTQFMVLRTQEVFGTLYDLRKDHEFTEKGEHTLTAFYENKDEAPASLSMPYPAWKGRLQSATVKVVLE